MTNTILLTLGLLLVPPMGDTQSAPTDEQAVRTTVEDFLDRLGSRRIDTLDDDLTSTALVIVSRQRDGAFETSVRTAAEWLAGMRQGTPGAPFREPLTNVQVTVDSGSLAYVRADFEVVRDGQVLSSGVDHFTLVRQPEGWKLAVIAYTSIPRARP